MVVMHHAAAPMVIKVSMVQTDVKVIKVVVPTPSKRSPPGAAPRPQPWVRAKTEAEANSPIIGEPRAKPIRTGRTIPGVANVGRVIIARAINDHVVGTDLSAQITGR